MPIKRLILRSVGKEHGILFDFDENAFIERTQGGAPEAFGPLVVKYHNRLYTHIYGRVKDAETAEDLTQETWLRAFRAM